MKEGCLYLVAVLKKIAYLSRGETDGKEAYLAVRQEFLVVTEAVSLYRNHRVFAVFRFEMSERVRQYYQTHMHYSKAKPETGIPFSTV